MRGEPCTFLDCDKPQHAKLLCYTHWKRLRRHGAPGIVMYGVKPTKRGRVDWANLPADDPRHGHANTYAYGCRCGACREAAKIRSVARKQNNPEKWNAYNREYQRNYYRSLAQLRNNHDPEFRGIHSEMKAHAG
jgi:hypothetical protein